MRGTRPLDNAEIRQVADCFDGTFATRNRGLFMFGVSTGDGRMANLSKTCDLLGVSSKTAR